MPETITAAGPARAQVRSADPALLEPATPVAPGKDKDKKAKKPKPTGKKRLVKPIMMLVVAFLAFHVLSPKFIKPHYSAKNPVPSGSIIELQTEAGGSSITTNLSDGHLAQLAISLQMTKVANMKEEAKDEDELMGDTIAILGQSTYNELLAPSGRAALRAALLANYQQVLGPLDGAQQVSGVYFTSFVLQ